MALVNRDKDQSEQREVYEYNFGLVATGATLLLGPVPYPCQVVAMQQASIGLSGTPVSSLFLNRFIPGSGITSIGLAATLTLSAIGTSGVQGYSTTAFGTTTLAQGSTTIQGLQAGDVVVLALTGSTSAVANLSVSLVVKSLQDVKTHFGV